MAYIFNDKIKFEYTTNFDSFGRLRISEPLTLFDSSNRFRDNGQFATSLTGTATATFNTDEGLMDLTIGTGSGDEIIRESLRVFAYQPGKSLLTLMTFTMAPQQSNLVQRIGYFNDNGFYIEQDGTTINIVERSSVTGAVLDNQIPQASWNVDPMDGSGPSGIVLDLTKSQIFWCDFEWLGVGSVRTGFVINGEFITCHVFHHANIITSTYITTACLPIRYEIFNSGITLSGSTLKQICSSVISEGGYELRGEQYSITTPITSAYTMTTSGTYYPIVSIRLKSDKLDSIVIPIGISLLPDSAGNYSYKIAIGGVTSGGTWVTGTTDTSVEYNITGVSFSGGTDTLHGFFAQSNQSSTSVNLSSNDVFQYQLKRNPFTSTALEFTLLVTSNGNGDTVFGSLNWQEITS